jgi:hypothetical protein
MQDLLARITKQGATSIVNFDWHISIINECLRKVCSLTVHDSIPIITLHMCKFEEKKPEGNDSSSSRV